MPRHDLLTVMMRRTYGGLFALMLDCTDPAELKWARELLQSFEGVRFPGEPGVPPEHHWAHRYRLHAVLPFNASQDWERQRNATTLLWSMLDKAGERGWEAFGAEVRSHTLSIEREEDRVLTYGLPYAYHFRRLAPEPPPVRHTP
jgi:hypothetical protein